MIKTINVKYILYKSANPLFNPCLHVFLIRIHNFSFSFFLILIFGGIKHRTGLSHGRTAGWPAHGRSSAHTSDENRGGAGFYAHYARLLFAPQTSSKVRRRTAGRYFVHEDEGKL